MRAATRERMISIHGQGLAWWQSCFSAGLVRLPLVRGLLHGINTGMCHKHDLTDQQWKILDPLVPEPARRRDGRGRPWKERRAVLNGILWVLRTGAPWVELPDRYPSYQTCHRRFQQWVQSGVMRGILEVLAAELKSTA